jgi:uncharacterized protein (TIGR00369 family)
LKSQSQAAAHFWEKLSIEKLEGSSLSLKSCMRVSSKHKRDVGIIHGGATCSLIDSTMKMFLKERDTNEDWQISDSKTSFILPGQGDYLIGEASIVSEEGSRKVIQCNIYDDLKHLIAIGTGIASKSTQSNQDRRDNSQRFMITSEEILVPLPSYVLERDFVFPFREFFKAERTVWNPGVCEIQMELNEEWLEPDGALPFSLLTVLTDMTGGQVAITQIEKDDFAYTLELSANLFSLIVSPAPKKLIAQGRVVNRGRVMTIQTIIFDEFFKGIGSGSSTYYVKRGKK